MSYHPKILPTIHLYKLYVSITTAKCVPYKAIPLQTERCNSH